MQYYIKIALPSSREEEFLLLLRDFHRRVPTDEVHIIMTSEEASETMEEVEQRLKRVFPNVRKYPKPGPAGGFIP